MSATKSHYNLLLITQRCSDKHLELLQALPVNGYFLNDIFKMSDWESYPVCSQVQNMAVKNT